MLIVAERINATRKPIREALERKDEAFFIQEAKKQEAAGAHFIDVNAGTEASQEIENLPWLVELIQDEVSIPLSLDSANDQALARALQVYNKKEVMINSFTAEEERIKAILPLAKDYNALVVGLAMGKGGIPQTVEDRIKLVDELVEAVDYYKIEKDKLLVDPLVVPIGTDHYQGKVFLETVKAVKEKYNEVRTICGLSNISYGMPNRKLLNRTFLVLALGYGLDASIMDPLDQEMMSGLYAALALLGYDEFCMNYLSAYRSGKLGS
ncbi:MAG TPA: dihydropteroate synthase [Candidatus Atribacteria bacterium]|nr:dihydropteroate synthase [Candidatus Atribacteria bacterium]